MRPAVAAGRLGVALVGLGRWRDGAGHLEPAIAELESTFYGSRAGFVEMQLAHARAQVALGERERARGIVATVRSRLDPSATSAEWGRVRATLAEVEALRAVAPEGVEVLVHDERLTTVSAQRSLGEARMGRDARRRVVDKVAAAVMLQAWLESGTR